MCSVQAAHGLRRLTPSTGVLMGIPIIGGPWHGRTYFGGGPNERTRLVTLEGGFYRVTADGEAVEWVATK